MRRRCLVEDSVAAESKVMVRQTVRRSERRGDRKCEKKKRRKKKVLKSRVCLSYKGAFSAQHVYWCTGKCSLANLN